MFSYHSDAPKRSTYGFNSTGEYLSPSSWWQNKLGYSRYDYSFSSATTKDYQLKQALYRLARTVNVVENGHSGTEESLTLRWGNEQHFNKPNDRFVTLPEKDFLEIAKTNEDQAIDMLTGTALTLASLKRTMSPLAFTFYQIAVQAKNTKTQPLPSQMAPVLFEAIETFKAQQAVRDDWAGFEDYFAVHQACSNTLKRGDIESLVEEAAQSPLAFSYLTGWNVLNPKDRVVFGDENLDHLLTTVEDMVRANTIPDNSYVHQLMVSEFILTHLPEPPPPPPSDSNDDEEEESESGGGAGAQSGSSSGDQTTPRTLNLEWKPSGQLTDTNLFGQAVNGSSTGELNLSDDSLTMNNPLNHFDYYPDKDVPLTSLGVVRVTSSDPSTYKQVVNETRNLTQQIKKSLAFRATDQKRWLHGLEEGEFDCGSLHKIGLNDPHVFSQRTVQSKPDVAITLLVDMSGSMSGRKEVDARKVAVALTEALKGLSGVHLSVLGHTADCSVSSYEGRTRSKTATFEAIQEGEKVMISELYSSRHTNPNALALIGSYANNYDGYAIEYAAKRQLKDYPHAKQRLVFVLSDGRPCNGNKHVKGSVETVRRRLGTQVYGIGVCNAYTESDGVEMFGKGYSVVLDDVLQSLPLLTRFLRTKLAKI